MKRLLLILCLIPVLGFGQFSGAKRLLLSQRGNIGNSILTINAIETTEPTSSVSKTIKASDNSSYIISSVKYINNGLKFVNPSDYSYTSPLTPGTDIYSTYYRFMSEFPYRSIWTTEALQLGNKLELTKPLYFNTIDTVYVGIFADNFFDLYVNGDTLAITNRSTIPNNQFLVNFHLFEVITEIGWNSFSLLGESDGTVSDALGFVVLNNTKDELFDNPVWKSSWDILWNSDSYVGQTINIATCPTGYNYDDVNNYCFINIPEIEISVGNIVSFSPIIDGASIVNPTSWIMYFGDGSSSSESTVTSKYSHIYTSTGTYNVQYIITTVTSTYIIGKSVIVH